MHPMLLLVRRLFSKPSPPPIPTPLELATREELFLEICHRENHPCLLVYNKDGVRAGDPGTIGINMYVPPHLWGALGINNAESFNRFTLTFVCAVHHFAHATMGESDGQDPGDEPPR